MWGRIFFRLWNISQCCLFQSSRISLFTIATVMIWGRDKELKGYKKGNWFLPCDESTEPPRDHTSQSPTYALTTEAVKMASTYCGIPVTLIAFFLHTQADKQTLLRNSATVTGEALPAQTLQITILMPLIFCFFHAGNTMFLSRCQTCEKNNRTGNHFLQSPEEMAYMLGFTVIFF